MCHSGGTLSDHPGAPDLLVGLPITLRDHLRSTLLTCADHFVFHMVCIGLTVWFPNRFSRDSGISRLFSPLPIPMGLFYASRAPSCVYWSVWLTMGLSGVFAPGTCNNDGQKRIGYRKNRRCPQHASQHWRPTSAYSWTGWYGNRRGPERRPRGSNV